MGLKRFLDDWRKAWKQRSRADKGDYSSTYDNLNQEFTGPFSYSSTDTNFKAVGKNDKGFESHSVGKLSFSQQDAFPRGNYTFEFLFICPILNFVPFFQT